MPNPTLQRLTSLAMGFTVLATTALAAPAPTSKPSFPDAPTLTQPAGAYQTAWITLAGTTPAPSIFLALRDGKPVQFWSTHMALPGLPKPQGSPKLLVDAIRGQTTAGQTQAQIDLRLVSVWAPQSRLGTGTLLLSLVADGPKLSGTWTMNVADKQAAAGTLSGSLADQAAADRADAIAPGQDWPSFYGTLSACRGPDYGRPLIDDLAKARPVWRSETVSLSGWGTGVDARYKGRAAYGTLCGGSSSPIVADGRVYLYHYRPSGDVEPDAAATELIAKVKDNPYEAEAVRRFFSKRADVVVTCLDGATGRTIWESVWPARQGNYQTHKWRALNHTPSIAKGTLVVSDYSWDLYAHDAKTGQLKWSRGAGLEVPHDRGAVGPVISGDVVIMAGNGPTLGLDLSTGKELWKAPAANSARRMIIDGQERILLVGADLILIDPASGKELTRTRFPGGVENKGKLDIGRGAMANLVCDGPYIVSFETVKAPAKDATATQPAKTVGNIFALKVTPNSIQPAWTNPTAATMEDGHIGLCISNGHVYTAFQDAGAYCIELTTGKTVKQLPDFTAHSNPIFVALDDRILWQPECQHGRQQIQLFNTAENFGPLGTNWKPPHNDTTAYGEMPIANITTDGRLILRGMDGIYCYDLRPQP